MTAEQKEIYRDWKDHVNMSRGELARFYDSEEGKKAGLSKSEASKQGIDYGRESARWILKMKDTPVSEWTDNMWRWAKKQINFINRMSGVKGRLYNEKGEKTRKHLALLIWGHNPEKKGKGGKLTKEAEKLHRESEQLVQFEPEGFDAFFMKRGGRTLAQTPAPPKERIYGSKINKEGSAESKSSAKEIKFSEETIEKLKSKVKEYNAEHKSKVTLETLKAVYRRGLGAYSSSHRPTISGGRPNTRNAWAMARVNKFLEKKAGKPVKKAYVQDDDLLENGGETGTLLAPNGKPSNLTLEQWHLVRTPEFKNWFGDWENEPENASKVVDENGEPKVLWHFSKRIINEADRFNVFRVDKQLGSHFGTFEQAKRLTPRAKILTEDEVKYKFYQVFLSIRNPIRMVDEGHFTETQLGRELWKMPTKDGKPITFDRLNTGRSELDNLKADLLENFLIDGVVYLNRYESGADDDLIIKLDNYSDEQFLEQIPEAEDSWIAFYPNQIKLADGSNTTFDAENPDIRYDEGGNLDEPKIALPDVYSSRTALKRVLNEQGYDLVHLKQLNKPSTQQILEQIAEKHNYNVNKLEYELQNGMDVEFEHTDDPEVAEKIALDHLSEHPKYYHYLAKMEELMKIEK